MPFFCAFAAICAAIYDLPVDSSPAISTIFPTGIPASFPRQIIESSHREPVGIQSFTIVGLSSFRLWAMFMPAFLLISLRISEIESLPRFLFFATNNSYLKNEAPVNPCLPAVAVQLLRLRS